MTEPQSSPAREPESTPARDPGGKPPVVVVGAGAAGLMAAIFAARGGARTVLVERKARPGAKILISGGGRCNVLPSQVALDDFHTSGSQNSLRKMLLAWPLDAVRAFFEEDLGIALAREPNGKLFPKSNRARDVLDALLDAAARAGAELVTDFELRTLRVGGEVGGSAPRFALEAADGRRLAAARVVLATGGLSIPKTGSDGLGLAIAAELGLPLVACYPALVPLVAPEGPEGPERPDGSQGEDGDGDSGGWRGLAGIALPVRLSARRGERIVEERSGDFLFTHRGFSGPVVLDLSRHLTAPAPPGPAGPEPVHLSVAWAPAVPWSELLAGGGRATVGALCREHLPRRLANLLLALAAVDPATPLAQLTRTDRRSMLRWLEAAPLPVVGTEGYRKAEVTGGGVELAAVRPDTFEARAIAGLHVIGELLDVTGRIGGFNFLWAWVTGQRAGQAVARLERDR